MYLYLDIVGRSSLKSGVVILIIKLILYPQLDMLGRGLVRREGSGDKQIVRPVLSIPAALELSYYANTIVVHYAAPAIVGKWNII